LHCGGDLTGAREAAGENMADLTGAWTAARHELMGVDGGVGWHGEHGCRRRAALRFGGDLWGQRWRGLAWPGGARMRRRGVLTGARTR
jgi:hypothetical protein